MEPVAAVILAAGLGKRMNSENPKVALSTREMPLIQHVLSSVAPLGPAPCVVVVGHKRELVEQAVKAGADRGRYGVSVTFAHQAEQRGTGDAVKCALSQLGKFQGTVLVLCGDAPLLRTQTLQALVRKHEDSKATVTLISFVTDHPNAYGRIVREVRGEGVARVVEAKDCSPEQLLIKECNASIYAVDSAFLAPAVKELTNENAQGEYYFTDIIERAVKEGQRVAALVATDPDEVHGVNDPVDLAEVNRILNARRIADLLRRGVTMADPSSVLVSPEAEIAPGVHIGPDVQIVGATAIEPRARIEGNAYIENCRIREDALIRFCVRMEQAEVGPRASVGPFAHLRPESVLEEDSRVGNFVETKKTTLAAGAKANHLAYLGDSSVGAHANIGAGTITCNYNGFTKSKTTIGEGAFIGSNTSLVAPVSVGEGAIVAAGSVITKDVPADSLAVARGRQSEKAGWAKRFRESFAKNKP
jgi:bifunctional UDP-N-acetylglucosamine pyrophosphorylase/glucosamine-1-phosphate N-acetyltransferase